MQTAITLVDRIFSFERNTLHHDLGRLVVEARTMKPAAGFALFVMGWVVGLAGSVVGLAVVAALVAGILLAKSSPAVQANQSDDDTSSLNAAVEARRQLAIANGMPVQLGINDLLSSAGLHVKKIEIAPVTNGRAKKQIEA